ncbi:hypothetical protein K502DRAFT_365914 [Neoconidiobolus thromboides FSU 785]|nr:hypothetical protein K502DRAFT_365914 [Neoconidiobolus thromboides FSU 785]
MINENPIGYLLNCIGAISAIASILLIYIVVKLRSYTRDLKLIILIASIELMFPLVSMSDIIPTIITNDDAINNPVLCQYLGFFTILLIFSQFIVSAFLAMERLKVVTKLNIIKYTIFPGILSLLFHICLSIYLAVNTEFKAQAAKLVCSIYPKTSVVSTIAFYHFIIISLMSLIIIILSYIKIAFYLTNLSQFIDLNITECNLDTTKNNKKRASLRIYYTLSLYSICMFLGLVSIVIDTIFHLLESNGNLQFIFGTIATTLMTLGFFLNSVLVLATHTAINHELKIRARMWYNKIFN